MPKNVHRAKLLLIGDQAVGKSSIAKMFVSDGSTYPRNYTMSFSVEVHSKLIPISGKDDAVDLLIYDIPGFSLYPENLERFKKKADIFMFVFDITNKNSYDSINSYLQSSLDQMRKDSRPSFNVLFGNKTDISNRRVCSDNEAKKFSDANALVYFTGSAKENMGLNECFNHVAESFYNNFPVKD